MAAKLLPRCKFAIKSFLMIPSQGGCFELKAGDKLLYSKLATGKFPDETALVDQLAKELGLA
ncbi:MAG: Rdx family protein [Planctomycetota bacterium]|nr:Rdx family protein [Planctomycetota bacterium]